ncbi:Carmil [Entamoeba marina]
MGNDLSFIDTDSFNQIGEYNIGYRKFTDKVCWSGVLRVTQGKKRRDAMVIVTKYRLHFFEPKTFKSPKFHTHLFDIKSIEVVNNTKILLRIYTSNKKKIKNLEFSEMNTFEMLRAIRTSIRDCTNAFPEDKILEVKDPLNATLPSSQSSLNQIQSMIESYLAVCSHENQLPSVNHIYHLQRLSLDGIYSIDFNQIPGVCDCKSPLSYNLQHAFTALGYCRSFTQIKLYEASVNRFEQALNALLRTNEYIQVLEVINCTKIDISLIADVLIESPVHVLNFHGTPLVKTNKLGYVLSKRHYNITKLDISNCGIRNLSNILVDCGKNEGLCKELIALDISENILNDEGLFALSVFLEKLADLNSKIQYLNLGELGLKIPIIMPKLKLLNLKYINISSTRFTKLDNAMELITYLQNSNSLKHICMSDMKLNTDHIVCVLSPIANNIKLENISLDLHNNNFGLDGGIELYKILPSFQNVQKLDLSGNRLKGKAMSRIITFMNDFQILNTLYIGENEMSGKELNNFFNNLIPFLQSHSNLKVLKINGIAEREDPSFIHFLEFMEKKYFFIGFRYWWKSFN